MVSHGFRQKLVLFCALIASACDNPLLQESGAPAYSAGPARPFTVAVAVGTPGHGGTGPAPCGTEPSYLTPVLRFHFHGNRPLEQLPDIDPCPASAVNDPIYVAFNRQGELFVGNRHGNQGVGSIARFVFDAQGNWIANGVISTPALTNVHGVTFDRHGELFAANLFTNTIHRFRFDGHGVAIANGVISTSASPMALAFNRQNELFTTSGNVVTRISLDRNGGAVETGSFLVSSSGGLHGIAFGPRDELFVSDIYNGDVYRFRFDGAGNLLPNGSFFVEGGPIGLAFSPEGELFVSSHFDGRISRFVFAADGTPQPNGVVYTPVLGGVAVHP